MATPVLVQQNTSGTSNHVPTTITALASANTAGNLLVLEIMVQNTGTVAVSDTLNGSWTLATKFTLGAPISSWTCWTFYVLNCAAGTPTYTWLLNGVPLSGSTNASWNQQEWSAGSGQKWICNESTASAGNASSTIATASLPIFNQSPDLMIGCGLTIAAGTATPSSGFTQLTQTWFAGFMCQYNFTSTFGAQSVSINCTVSGALQTTAAAFSTVSTTAAPTPPPQGLTVLGSTLTGTTGSAYDFRQGCIGVASGSNPYTLQLTSPGIGAPIQVNTNAGSTIVAIITWPAVTGSVTSVSDNINTGNYTACGTLVQAQGNSLAAYYFTNSVSGLLTLSVQLSAPQTVSIAIYEFYGPAVASVDVYSTSSGAATTTPSLGITTTANPDVLIAAVTGGTVSTFANGFSGQSSAGFGTSWLSPGVAGSYTSLFGTTSAAYAILAFALKPASTGGNDITKLADANSWTWWTNPNGTGGDWVGVDCGVSTYLSSVRLSFRPLFEDMVNGAFIEASNDPTWASGVFLYVLATRNASSYPAWINGTLLNSYTINCPAAYRYFRFVMPAIPAAAAIGNGGLADIEFVGQYASGMNGQSGIVLAQPPGGIYDLPTSVTLSCESTQATILYTTDGSNPQTSGTAQTYSSPFVVSANAPVQFCSKYGSLATGRVRLNSFHIASIVPTDTLYELGNNGYRLWGVSGKISYDPSTGNWIWAGFNQDQPGVYFNGGIGINIYTSPDLRNWTRLNTTIIFQPTTARLGINKNFNLTYYGDRCRILYNAANTNYVLWWRQGFGSSVTSATATSLNGPWTQVTQYSGSNQINGNTPGGDFDVFLDPSSSIAYLVISFATFTGIYHLNTAYTAWDGTNFYNYAVGNIEAPTMLEAGGDYFLMNSAVSNWSPNQNNYIEGAAALGPFTGTRLNPFQTVTGITNPNGPNPTNTNSYDTQIFGLVVIPGRPGYIWFGDRYDIVNPNTLEDPVSNFVNWIPIMMPLVVSGATLSISYNGNWTFDGSFPTSTGMPAAPTTLGLSVASQQVTLTWTNTAALAYALYVDRATNPTFTAGVASFVVSQGTSSFIDTTIAAWHTATVPLNNNYYYRIRAVNASGSGISTSQTLTGFFPGPSSTSGSSLLLTYSPFNGVA